LAFAGEISFRQALGRLHDTREAVATAQPYSAAVLAYARTFIYRDGVLSYVTNNEIRVLNVHTADREEQVVDVQNVLRRIIPRFCQHEAESRSAQLSFLHYSSGILAILVEVGDTDAWLILLDVTPGGSKQPKGYKPGRLRFVTQLECTRRLFVRHNGAHLFYGVNSIVDASGELLWAVHWADLTKENRAVDTQPTVLDKLAGTDLGHNVCFEIFDNHLYAVSNTIDSEEEALNWRSFYEWVRIPPNCRWGRAQMRRIWRRDHLEGPINDTWTEMSLRLDEATGEPMILECRREWREGGSDHVRTYYTEPLRDSGTAPNEAEPAAAVAERRETETDSTSSSSPPNLLTGGTGPSNINFAAPPFPLPLNGPTEDDLQLHRRPGRHVHSEYSASCSTKRDFILAKTKYRTYNLSACAFIDVVNDPEPNNRPGAATDRVRLRINARKRKHNCIEDESDNHASKCRPHAHIKNNSTARDEQIASDNVLLWPPDNADEDLIKLLCPTRKATNINAIADERSLIYSVDTGDPQLQQAIILISFDPQIRLPCMRGNSRKKAKPDSARVGISVLNDRVKIRQRFEVGSSCTSSKSSVRTEPAMHLAINKGYWFDRNDM
jgi:hypothetical protein